MKSSVATTRRLGISVFYIEEQLIIVQNLRKFGYKLDSGNGGNAVFAEGITKPNSGAFRSPSIGGALGT